MGVSRSTTVYNGSVAAAATATARMTTQNAESMLVIWTITDSGATGDIGATTVKPYTPYRDSANVEVTPTVIETLLPASVVAAVTRVGTVAAKTDRYDVRGIDQVELKITNAAGGAKDVEVHVYLFSS